MSVAVCNSCNVFFIVVLVIRACRCKDEGGGGVSCWHRIGKAPTGVLQDCQGARTPFLPSSDVIDKWRQARWSWLRQTKCRGVLHKPRISIISDPFPPGESGLAPRDWYILSYESGGS